MTRSPTPTTVTAARRTGNAHLLNTPLDGDWTALAACRDVDPDELFVQGAAQNRVKTRCFGCLVRTQCLADALDNHVEFGVWGGMTERERRALLRRRPDVRSWKKLLADAQADHRARSAAG
ncbi:MAG: WhiB family transcriptional regulator [Frankia sp.]|nr:WhiB family transcriptional regulator [Frankia sp.]